MIAHDRDEASIARHIGATKVIYQTIEDLKAACAELSPRKEQIFEVGVFSGEYVTPVDAGYFEHLERIRGKTKKLKVVERTKEAVARGSVGAEEIRIVTNGAEVNAQGKVVPTSGPTSKHDGNTSEAGGPNDRIQGDELKEPDSPKDRMDISMHNFGDYGKDPRS